MMMNVKRNDWNSEKRGDLSVSTFNCLRRNYKFRSSFWCDENTKDWANRRALLQKILDDEMRHMDILGLQEAELETLDEDFGFLYDRYGRVSAGGEGSGRKKKSAKQMEKERVHCFTKPTIFFRKDRFEVSWVESRSRAVMVELVDLHAQARGSDCVVLVCNVHLTGGPSAESEKERSNQIKSCCKYLSDRMSKWTKERPERRVEMVIVGDFNCDFVSEWDNVFSMMCDEKRERLVLPEPLKPVYDDHSCPFSFKWGTLEPVYMRIDHILVSANLKPVALREPFTDQQMTAITRDNEGIPSPFHPSDHVPLACALNRL